jgi:asparagine synthase (glutamine-hydrolysing)
MCGLNGQVRREGGAPLTHPDARVELLRTCDALARRGPDGAGSWVSPSGDCALAHRRLAILDLSSAGEQPMASADGRYVGVLNGEIYNFRALREELVRGGFAPRSVSDTEVILELFARRGVDALSRLRGMFALAIWDQVERRLLLARDPFGIKPLYLAASRDRVRFASQARVLRDALDRAGEAPATNAAALGGFLLWGSVPEPFSLWRGISAVPAGSYLWVDARGPSAPVRYHQPTPSPAPSSLAEALEDTVRAHLVSDVPVGVFLSAGLDSSVLAALAARLTGAPLGEPAADRLVTVTAAFDLLEGGPLEERTLAAETARVLGTRHVETRLTRDDFHAAWPDIQASMDQPSIDGANSYLVAMAARRAGLKVALSGLGGDELFGSYATFSSVPRTRRWVHRAESAGLGAAVDLLATRLSASPKAAALRRHGATLEGCYLLRRGLYLPDELPALLGAEAARETLERHDPLERLREARRELEAAGVPADDEWAAIHWLETRFYMSHTLLRDADWSSMAHGLELRVPFVDATLHAQVLALGFEPARTRGKAEAFRGVAPELPPALWSRPKTGFYIPVVEWLEERERATAPNQRGQASRRLAMRVLEGFGVGLDGAVPREIQR